MSRRRKVPEGSWFSVPLDRGYALGLLARTLGPGGVGFFFPDRIERPPATSDLPAFAPSDAIFVCRFTLGHLQRGDWPVSGLRSGWRREDWSPPPFCRFDELKRRYMIVHYADDPFEPFRESVMPDGETPERYWSDDFVGERMLPTLLARLLD